MLETLGGCRSVGVLVRLEQYAGLLLFTLLELTPRRERHLRRLRSAVRGLHAADLTGRVRPQGGSRLSGRWSLVSGCELADYLHLMSLVYDDDAPRMLAPGQPDLRVLFVPKGSFETSTLHAAACGLRRHTSS